MSTIEAERDASGRVQAVWNGTVLADSERTVLVEGNHYFPPQDVDHEHLEPNEHRTICSWKGEASYYDAVVEGTRGERAGWFYPDPKPEALNIKDHVAFGPDVQVGAAAGS